MGKEKRWESVYEQCDWASKIPVLKKGSDEDKEAIREILISLPKANKRRCFHSVLSLFTT